jgi:hypothetical protein
MNTEDVVERLTAWDEAYGLTIWRADVESVEFDLAKKPEAPKAFAEEIHAFCPDAVDQGVGTLEALEDQLARGDTVYLWWD